MTVSVAEKALRLLQISVADVTGRESHVADALSAALNSGRAIDLIFAQQRFDSLDPYTRKRIKGRAINEAHTFSVH
ncbi:MULTISPECIES: hypothetical protein [Nisaea]|jgi:hypothetical protein|uniref:hypothetical protein n=1 Tax=Nisaea TaxID=390876 RepID=UPI0018677E1C|nr:MULTISPECIES: hypothetical protein [Nisaea]